MKTLPEILRTKEARERFESYSAERQDKIIDRVYRKKYEQMLDELDQVLEEYEKHPEKFYRIA